MVLMRLNIISFTLKRRQKILVSRIDWIMQNQVWLDQLIPVYGIKAHLSE